MQLSKRSMESMTKKALGGFTIVALVVYNCLTAPVWAESNLYIEQQKTINGSFEYRLPKLELNQQKFAGTFLGSKCYYLSEFEGALVYTAPRGEMFKLNHHSIEAAWNLGVEVGPLWATYSIGGREYLEGNDSGIPAGLEMFNTLRGGITWQ